MPIYEYECDGCGETFAVRQKMSDPAPSEHACGSHSVRRVLSATSFVLKGTGWYKTDYADKPRPTESSASASGDEGKKADKAEGGNGADRRAGASKADPASQASPAASEGHRPQRETATTPSAPAAGKPSGSKPAA